MAVSELSNVVQPSLRPGCTNFVALITFPQIVSPAAGKKSVFTIPEVFALHIGFGAPPDASSSAQNPQPQGDQRTRRYIPLMIKEDYRCVLALCRLFVTLITAPPLPTPPSTPPPSPPPPSPSSPPPPSPRRYLTRCQWSNIRGTSCTCVFEGCTDLYRVMPICAVLFRFVTCYADLFVPCCADLYDCAVVVV